MVADVRFSITKPIRSVAATVLYPLQWLLLQPLRALGGVGDYFQTLSAAQSDRQDVRLRLTQMMTKATAQEQLRLENQRLRQLLDLRQKPETTGIPIQADKS